MNKKPEYVTYFQEKDFQRLLYLLKEKYCSLSRFSGSVHIRNLTEGESKDFSSFFGKTFLPGSDTRISFKQIEHIMQNTKYQNFDWQVLFETYFDSPLQTKIEFRKQVEDKENQFFQNILESLDDGVGTQWLIGCVQGKNEIYQLLRKRYNQNHVQFHNDLIHIINLLNHLPSFNHELMSLPMFAGIITTNPHFLDMGSKNNHLFLKALADMNGMLYPNEHYEKIHMLLKFGIYVDSLSNTVITNGLIGHELLDVFYQNNQPLILNLENLLQIDNVDTKRKKVFVFENPSILNAMRDKKMYYPVVITSGIPNLALYQLLDKLVTNKNQLYYNGDFDPEGLLIADKLKSRYGNQLTLFQYDKQDYEQSKSNEIITSSRLKKLDMIVCSELLEMKRTLLEERISAFQEKNIECIIDKIKKLDI